MQMFWHTIATGMHLLSKQMRFVFHPCALHMVQAHNNSEELVSVLYCILLQLCVLVREQLLTWVTQGLSGRWQRAITLASSLSSSTNTIITIITPTSSSYSYNARGLKNQQLHKIPTAPLQLLFCDIYNHLLHLWVTPATSTSFGRYFHWLAVRHQ